MSYVSLHCVQRLFALLFLLVGFSSAFFTLSLGAVDKTDQKDRNIFLLFFLSTSTEHKIC